MIAKSQRPMGISQLQLMHYYNTSRIGIPGVARGEMNSLQFSSNLAQYLRQLSCMVHNIYFICVVHETRRFALCFWISRWKVAKVVYVCNYLNAIHCGQLYSFYAWYPLYMVSLKLTAYVEKSVIRNIDTEYLCLVFTELDIYIWYP